MLLLLARQRLSLLLRLSCCMAPNTLTFKRARFVEEYLIDSNATQAAIRAGYSPHTAESQGCRLLRNVKVSAAVAEAQDRQAARGLALADDVVDGMRTLAYTDRTGMFDANGNIRPVDEWPEDLRYCVEGLEVVKRNAFAGDGKQDIVWRVRFAPKLAAHVEVAKAEGRYPREPPQVVTAVVYKWGDASQGQDGKV